jgi:hypothetical protein
MQAASQPLAKRLACIITRLLLAPANAATVQI